MTMEDFDDTERAALIADEYDVTFTTGSMASTSSGPVNGSRDNVDLWLSDVSLNYTIGMMILVAVLLTVVLIGTAFGNLVVVIALVRCRNLRTVSNYLIGNLALSDFLLATTILPLSTVNECLGYWVFGRAMCNVWLTLDVLYCTASIWNLCVIAFDRFTATLFPVWYRGRRLSAERQAAIYAVVVWLVAAVICVPPLLGWNYDQNYELNGETGVWMCNLFQTRGYVIYSASGSFFVPFVVTLFFYASIFVVLHARVRRNRSLKSKSASMPMTSVAASDRKKKSIRVGLTFPEIELSSTSNNLAVNLDVECTSIGDLSIYDVDEFGPKTGSYDDVSRPEVEKISASTVDLSAAGAQIPEAKTTTTMQVNNHALTLQLPPISVGRESGNGYQSSSALDVPTDPGRRRQSTPNIGGTNLISTEPTASLKPPTSTNLRTSNSFVFGQRNVDRPNLSSGTAVGVAGGKLQTTATTSAGTAAATTTTTTSTTRMARRQQRAFDQREMRATVRMAIIIAFFCGFWLGFFVVYVVRGCCPDNCAVPNQLFAFFFWLGYSNSSVNPILYTIFNEEFRRAFQRVLGCDRAAGGGGRGGRGLPGGNKRGAAGKR